MKKKMKYKGTPVNAGKELKISVPKLPNIEVEEE
jgi:hypothetical protein